MKRRTDPKGAKPLIGVTLAGAPNVGKSTVFNALTGLRQHTGNWTGKTVESARGYFETESARFSVTDVPGTYSLTPRSADEEVAKRYIEEHRDDVTVVVCDASGLRRSLPLAMAIAKIAPRCVIFLNLCDEAKRAGIEVDAPLLSRLTGIPVVAGSARNRRGIGELIPAVEDAASRNGTTAEAKGDPAERSDEICRVVVSGGDGVTKRDRVLDKIFSGKVLAFPVTAAFLALIFWLTLEGANYPSDALRKLFSHAEGWLGGALGSVLPSGVTAFLTEGVFRTAAWVVSVMLPPMAIFFPLFTLLEDFGYLPRVAFNLDRACRACGGCGKMSLCMCMGLGCNAVGITGCRIIDSPRERLIARLTNSFIPCNGRFPTLIVLIPFLFSGGSVVPALVLTALTVLSVAASLGASKLLSVTLFKGAPSSFALELPPYRRPKIGEVAVRSVFDRTLRVTCRALAVAAPAGGVIWLFANIKAGDASLLSATAGFLDPVGRFFGLDGAILLAFILGLPANEIILPILIMIYMSSGTLPETGDLPFIYGVFSENGWTAVTAVCTVILFLFHSPCATSLITLKKETGSVKYTLLGAALPVMSGLTLCAAVNFFARIFS